MSQWPSPGGEMQQRGIKSLPEELSKILDGAAANITRLRGQGGCLEGSTAMRSDARHAIVIRVIAYTVVSPSMPPVRGPALADKEE